MSQEELQRNGLVRTRFYSRSLWNHLQRRTIEKTTVTHRSAVSMPARAVTGSSKHLVKDVQSSEGRTPLSVSRAICERLSEVLAIRTEDIDPSKPAHVYGVDSLVAMEMRVWFKEALQMDVAVFEIMSNRPIEVLAREVVLMHV
ncbi:acyl carrier protein [Aspergillus mulundensis]|uniref:Carrier domain-containing protein n=1 Tax=Aspergillus mulundensis TaxID=1810919 RepID=A0A3D8T2E1_9EURO|nr:hypothetical protein DSM5745_00001 [Aspergillus mulundensis]RDW92679.1 hypothetical protein DSM5745_00001 [Aspergillus mulundensis]